MMASTYACPVFIRGLLAQVATEQEELKEIVGLRVVPFFVVTTITPLAEREP